MIDYKSRITSDPEILQGKPIIKGTRIPVELILKKMAEGLNAEELLKAYPQLSKEDILASLSYSSEVIANEALIG